jgi:hypothetical protein
VLIIFIGQNKKNLSINGMNIKISDNNQVTKKQNRCPDQTGTAVVSLQRQAEATL